MNRSERRRQAREAAKRTLHVPDGTLVDARVLTRTGVAEVTNFRDMPAKRPGHHRWVAVVSHLLGDEQAEAWADGGGQVLLDLASILYAGLGCVDCEAAYEEARGRRCPAGDEWAG